MALNIDAGKRLEELAPALHSVMNGDFAMAVTGIFETAKHCGDDVALVDGMKEQCMNFQNFFNDEAAPAINKFVGNTEGLQALLDTIKNQAINVKKASADVGTVHDNNYDAAKNL